MAILICRFTKLIQTCIPNYTYDICMVVVWGTSPFSMESYQHFSSQEMQGKGLVLAVVIFPTSSFLCLRLFPEGPVCPQYAGHDLFYLAVCLVSGTLRLALWLIHCPACRSQGLTQLTTKSPLLLPWLFIAVSL